MTTRTRGTYTARLYAAPRRRRRRFVTAPRVVAALAVLAEAGHLFAALADWPAGLFHVVMAGCFGFLAVYNGQSRWWLGATLGLAAPGSWLALALLGFVPYPLALALGLTVLELALAGTQWTFKRAPAREATATRRSPSPRRRPRAATAARR